MQITKGFKYRIYTNSEQQTLISKLNDKYDASFNATYDENIKEIKPNEMDLNTKSIGIDLNIADIALNNGDLIKITLNY